MAKIIERKNEIVLKTGAEIYYCNRRYFIKAVLNLEELLLVDLENKTKKIINISQLNYRPKINVENISIGQDVQSIGDDDWNKALKKYEVIKPLLMYTNRTRADVQKRAEEYNYTVSALYKWIKIYESEGLITSLLPKKRSDKGEKRLDNTVEMIITNVINEYYLSPKRKSIAYIQNEIKRICLNSDIEPPHKNTIRKRIKELPEYTVVSHRLGKKEAEQQLQPKIGKFPNAEYPLSVWQIDHTELDIILVDDIYRRPIGRPWITVAIDVYSRMTVGFYISFDPPSALSVGLCLSQAILPKDKFVQSYDLKQKWPVWGIPKKVHADNAKEFRGAMLTRACQQYGIDLEWRPVARPRFGGHIERLQGTFLRQIHDLAGTTFSNTSQRKGYDSENFADKTLTELEEWFAILVVDAYHIQKHSGLNMTPLAKYTEGILGTAEKKGIGLPPRIIDENKLKLDFMPFVMRSIQDYGVVIDNIHYYHDVLRRWINSKDPENPREKRKFTFRRDSRDISKIWFFDPEVNTYYPIPYRNISNPKMSIWDLKEAKRKAKNTHLDDKSEKDIIDAFNRLRKIEESASEKTKSVRKSHQRRSSGFVKAKNYIKSTHNESVDNLNNQIEGTLIAKEPKQILPFEELDDLIDE
ncbi:DDE-type integrase/transposase/recombinase [Acinetobacter baumannii]|nr:DDE-type integrase/transposase/recombinase [Acinetobacter baumannii]MDC5448916.1 DDE-type integrase/transposase/recombinase [Acinetobacter baumannii]